MNGFDKIYQNLEGFVEIWQNLEIFEWLKKGPKNISKANGKTRQEVQKC